MQFKASVIEQKSIITIKQFILKIFFSEFVFFMGKPFMVGRKVFY